MGGLPVRWAPGRTAARQQHALLVTDLVWIATDQPAGVDLDRIVDASTGEVDSQNLDFSGASLRHAYVVVHFSDGFHGQARLTETGWDVTQVLRIGDAVSPVPEPVPGFMLAAGLGLVTLARRRAGRAA
jgi:hypothetical protein